MYLSRSVYQNPCVKIRLANPEDCLPIANLHAESWRNAYQGMFSAKYLEQDIFADRRHVWGERFQNPKPGQYVIVAEDGLIIAKDDRSPKTDPKRNSKHELIGFACAFANDHPRWGALLDNLHVLPSLKRQGIGTKLTAHIAVWIVENYPGQGMSLHVLESNSAARKFYERVGGVPVEELLWTAPDGNKLKEFRYAWTDLTPLLALQ